MKLAVTTGSLVGLIVWLSDYSFFLNSGGPKAPVSAAILRVTHLQSLSYPAYEIVPLLALVISGALAGWIVARLVRAVFESRKRSVRS